MRVIALLDSMWTGQTGRAPRFFRINPYNFTGRRLYRLIGLGNSLVVTNCCREQQLTASHHGLPDPEYVRSNLTLLRPRLLLVCGRVARRTYDLAGYTPEYGAVVIRMKHPAARTWTSKELDQMTRRIAKCIVSQQEA